MSATDVFKYRNRIYAIHVFRCDSMISRGVNMSKGGRKEQEMTEPTELTKENDQTDQTEQT